MHVTFVLGSHRTGTKSIAAFFCAYFPEVESHHQFNSLRWVNIFSNMLVSGSLSRERFENLIQSLVVKRIKASSRPAYIESNGFNYMAAYYAQKSFEQTKIIHVVRDPRDFVISYLNWTNERWQSKFAHRFVPYWNVNGHKAGEVTKSEWKRMNQFERFCWNWKFKNQKILDLYAKNDNFLSVKFEELMDAATRKGVIQKILSFVGLKYQDGCEAFFNEKHNVSKGAFFPKWRGWNESQCRALQHICRDLMEQYGYGLEPEWQSKLKE